MKRVAGGRDREREDNLTISNRRQISAFSFSLFLESSGGWRGLGRNWPILHTFQPKLVNFSF